MLVPSYDYERDVLLFFSTQQCVDTEMNRALLVRSAQDEITSTITLEVNAWEMEDNHAMGHWRF